MKVFKIFSKVILIGSTLFLLAFTFFIFYCLYDVPKLNTEALFKRQTSRIYDKNGSLIYEVGTIKQEWISINNINDNMINALISVEDSRFYEHSGIDYKRLIKATINNIKDMSFKEGASTINQQLIKNVFLSSDKTFKRKTQEIYLSMLLDEKLTKDQILEAYLNNCLFCNNIYGVEKASFYFFNHSAKTLSVEEAALLAGLLQLPNYYNPYKNYDACLKRRNIVIDLMFKNNFLSLEERNIYKEKEIILEKKETKHNYQSYIEYVLYELKEKHNIDIYSSSYDIYTALSPSIQKEIDNIMNTNKFLDESMNAGIVALDNSGLIEGIGGIKNSVELGLNYAHINLQTGSTIKPILDYAPSFEYLNYGTGSMICDEPYSYSNGTKIKNWDNDYYGNITFRSALANSRNIPALKLFQELEEKAYDFSKMIGISKKEAYNEAQAIGGFNIGYSVLEMANAYSSFANMGKYIESHAIIMINKEKVVFKEYTAMKESTAFMINDILHSAVKGTNYNVDGMYLCAKTGQTNYDYNTRMKYAIPANATKDSWMIGYSKNKTIAIWTGYDSYNNYLDSSKVKIARNMFKYLMSKYSNYDNSSYCVPGNICKVLIEKGNNLPFLANKESLNVSYEYFIIGTEPKSYKTS